MYEVHNHYMSITYILPGYLRQKMEIMTMLSSCLVFYAS